MKTSVFQYLIVFSVLIAVGLSSCEQIVSVTPTVPISISIYGSSQHPVNLSWAIHGESGTVSSRILNYDNQSPMIIERLVDATEYGPVELTISDSGSTGNNIVASGALNSAIGTKEKTITLDADTEIPPGSGNFIIKEDDFLRDTAGLELQILEDPTVNRIVKVADETDQFTSGAWDLLTSNRSSITATFKRDGITLHTMTGSTDTEAVSMAYGSLYW